MGDWTIGPPAPAYESDLVTTAYVCDRCGDLYGECTWADVRTVYPIAWRDRRVEVSVCVCDQCKEVPV